MSKYEQKLIERFKRNGGVVDTEKLKAAFIMLIRPVTTLGVDKGGVSNVLEDYVFELTKGRKFSSSIAALAIFPQICDPAIYSASDNIRHNRKEKSVSIGINIDHKLWSDSTRAKRIELLRENVVESIQRVPEKLLVSDDRDELVAAVNKAATSLSGNE